MRLETHSKAQDKFLSIVRVEDGPYLSNRVLFDIILEFRGHDHIYFAHSVYTKDTWVDFKFIHATDLHISKRLDNFRNFLLVDR